MAHCASTPSLYDACTLTVFTAYRQMGDKLLPSLVCWNKVQRLFLPEQPSYLLTSCFWFGDACLVFAPSLPIAGSRLCPRTRKESSAANYPWLACLMLPSFGIGSPLSSALPDDQSRAPFLVAIVVPLCFPKHPLILYASGVNCACLAPFILRDL